MAMKKAKSSVKKGNKASLATPEKTSEQIRAEMTMTPIMTNTLTAKAFAEETFGEIHVGEAFDVMIDSAFKVLNGDLSEAESTLIAQSTVLNTIFNDLARRAASNLGKYPEATERYLRMALKAQSQCRVTLQTLSEIKNPRPTAFVNQANIAHGPQQINNNICTSDDPSSRTHARNSENPSNELLGANNGKWLDTRTQGKTGGVDPKLETVGKINRP